MQLVVVVAAPFLEDSLGTTFVDSPSFAGDRRCDTVGARGACWTASIPAESRCDELSRASLFQQSLYVTRFSNTFLIKSVSYRLDFANRPPTSRRRLGTASRPHHFHHVYSPVLHHRASRCWTFCVYCVLPEKNNPVNRSMLGSRKE